MKLYHYTKLDTAIRKILPNLNLRLNNLENMNDPIENLYHIIEINENVDDSFSYLQLSSDEYLIAKKIREETKIASFTIDSESLKDNFNSIIKGYERQRMWSQYGDNNAGICIELDYEKFKKENSEQIKELNIKDGKVLYKNFQYKGIPTPLYGKLYEENKINDFHCLCDFWLERQLDSKFVNDRFFTKNTDWEGESEYRFLTFQKNSNDIFLSIKESLLKVILGINFSKYNLPSILGIVPIDKIFGLRPNFEGTFELRKVSFTNTN